jgi:hypothetical protein
VRRAGGRASLNLKPLCSTVEVDAHDAAVDLGVVVAATAATPVAGAPADAGKGRRSGGSTGTPAGPP